MVTYGGGEFELSRDGLKGSLIRRRSSMLLGICKGIKLQVQMASLWPFFIVVGEWWKETC